MMAASCFPTVVMVLLFMMSKQTQLDLGNKSFVKDHPGKKDQASYNNGSAPPQIPNSTFLKITLCIIF